MKKLGILNSEIARVLASMGHTDYIVICDCGLPIPNGAKRIDLAVAKGFPSFIDIVKAVQDDFVIEKSTVAIEMKEFNSKILKQLEAIEQLKDIEFVTHEEFKSFVSGAKAVIRTGEATPFANIILHGGVIF